MQKIVKVLPAVLEKVKKSQTIESIDDELLFTNNVKMENLVREPKDVFRKYFLGNEEEYNQIHEEVMNRLNNQRFQGKNDFIGWTRRYIERFYSFINEGREPLANKFDDIFRLENNLLSNGSLNAELKLCHKVTYDLTSLTKDEFDNVVELYKENLETSSYYAFLDVEHERQRISIIQSRFFVDYPTLKPFKGDGKAEYKDEKGREYTKHYFFNVESNSDDRNPWGLDLYDSTGNIRVDLKGKFSVTMLRNTQSLYKTLEKVLQTGDDIIFKMDNNSRRISTKGNIFGLELTDYEKRLHESFDNATETIRNEKMNSTSSLGANSLQNTSKELEEKQVKITRIDEIDLNIQETNETKSNDYFEGKTLKEFMHEKGEIFKKSQAEQRKQENTDIETKDIPSSINIDNKEEKNELINDDKTSNIDTLNNALKNNYNENIEHLLMQEDQRHEQRKLEAKNKVNEALSKVKEFIANGNTLNTSLDKINQMYKNEILNKLVVQSLSLELQQLQVKDNHISKLYEQLSGLRGDIKEKDSKIETLDTKVVDLNKKVSLLEDNIKENEESYLKQLKDNTEKFELVAEKLKNTEKDKAELELNLSDIVEELNSVAQRLKDKNIVSSNIEEISDFEKVILELNKANVSMTDYNEELESKIVEINTKNTTLNEQLKDISDRYNKLNEKYIELNKQNTILETKVTEMNEVLATHEAKNIHDLSQKVNAIVIYNDNLKKEAESKKDEASSYKNELNKERQTNDDLSKRNNELFSLYENVRKKLEDFTNSFKNNSNNSEKDKQILDLQNKLNEYEFAFKRLDLKSIRELEELHKMLVLYKQSGNSFVEDNSDRTDFNYSQNNSMNKDFIEKKNEPLEESFVSYADIQKILNEDTNLDPANGLDVKYAKMYAIEKKYQDLLTEYAVSQGYDKVEFEQALYYLNSEYKDENLEKGLYGNYLDSIKIENSNESFEEALKYIDLSNISKNDSNSSFKHRQ